jgi:hypothetical protein
VILCVCVCVCGGGIGLVGMADLERGLARLQACGIGAGSGRDADNVVLYEDQGKRRVGALLSAINGLKVHPPSTPLPVCHPLPLINIKPIS